MSNAFIGRLFKLLAYINIIAVAIIMTDFAVKPVKEEKQLHEFNAKRIRSGGGKFGGKTTIDYFIDLSDGERINLSGRSKLEFILKQNDNLLVYKTPFLYRNKYIEYKSAHINIVEKTSLLQSTFTFSLLIISGLLSFLYLLFFNRRLMDGVLGTALLINAVIVLLYFSWN